MITPYIDSLNEKIAQSLQDDGLEVAGIHGLGITENFAIAEVEPERIAQFASECFADSDIELLFASCTNFRAFDARRRSTRRLGFRWSRATRRRWRRCSITSACPPPRRDA